MLRKLIQCKLCSNFFSILHVIRTIDNEWICEKCDEKIRKGELKCQAH